MNTSLSTTQKNAPFLSNNFDLGKKLTSVSGTRWHRLKFSCSSPLSTTKYPENNSTDNDSRTLNTG